MASIILTREQRAAVEQARREGKRRVRMDLTPAQREAMARAEAAAERERSWIETKSAEAKQRHEAQVRRIASLLRDARQTADISLTQLAERTGMTRQAISRIESGENRNPTVSTLVRLAEALDKRWVIDLQDVA